MAQTIINTTSAEDARRQFEQFCAATKLSFDLRSVPIITRDDLTRVVSEQVSGRNKG